MPNYVPTRLILSGPASEIARFMHNCIRIRTDDGADDTPSLDFDAIVPMPPEIVATQNNATEQLKAVAYAATGYRDWYEWCRAHWGTKWNTCDFRGRLIDDTIYDCDFTTAWSCPIPALVRLATDYPSLHGAVVANDPGMDWSLTAAIGNGSLIPTGGCWNRQVEMLIQANYRGASVASASLAALLELSDEWTTFTGQDARSWLEGRMIQAIDRMGEIIGGDLPEALKLERLTWAICNRLDQGETREDIFNDELVEAPDARASAEFLMADDRTRMPIDRALLKFLTGSRRTDTACEQIGDEDLEIEALDDSDEQAAIEGPDAFDVDEMDLLEEFSEADLREWAFVAMHRREIDVEFDFTDDGLAETFCSYARQLDALIGRYCRMQRASREDRGSMKVVMGTHVLQDVDVQRMSLTVTPSSTGRSLHA